jgi:broad specificity phosphatase PhoE
MSTVEAGPAAGSAFLPPELPDDAELWLIRHGETEWSASGQHTSTTDLPLTEAGEQQAHALRDVLGHLTPALVLSSPRRRAQDTARLAGLTVDETTDDLAEWNYGAYEGRTSAEIRRDNPGWSIWSDGVPGGESQRQIADRADRVLNRAAQALLQGPVVLVGHGHFSRVLGARWIGLPVASGAHLLLGTAAPSVLGAQYGVPVIARWNLPNPAA